MIGAIVGRKLENSLLVQRNSLQKVSNPVTIERHNVEYSHSRAAGYL